MPFVKIHISSAINPSSRQMLAKDVRNSLVDSLGIKENHGHVVVYDAPQTSRCTHESRNPNFVFVEILMFSGRPDEVKERLFKKLSEIVHIHTGVEEKDILLTVIETERSNWAVRGVPISKIDLGY